MPVQQISAREAQWPVHLGPEPRSPEMTADECASRDNYRAYQRAYHRARRARVRSADVRETTFPNRPIEG